MSIRFIKMQRAHKVGGCHVKTFKLCSIHLLKGQNGKIEQLPISIKDGLIINMENEEKTWYIDAVFAEEHVSFFKDMKENNKHILVEVVITSPDNPPAAMITSVDTITELSEHISVLFKAKMTRRIDDTIRNIVKSMLDKGIKGEDMLDNIHHQMKNEPAFGKQSLDDLYKTLKKSGQYELI